MMADLLTSRLGMEAPPFFYAEMDYFGPLNVKQD